MNNTYTSIKDIINHPWAERFFYQKTNAGYSFGNQSSYMKNDGNVADITFDISNNKVLANMDVFGTLKNLTIFRDTYRANESHTRGWPGVWLHKDFAEFGPYWFEIKINGMELQSFVRDTKTGFIDNIVPVTQMITDAAVITCLFCTPVSADGKERLRGAIYGAYIENTADAELDVEITLPKLFQDTTRLDAPRLWKFYRGDDFEISLLDSRNDLFEVRAKLHAGEYVWVPVAIYAPGDEFVGKVNEKGSIYWISETIRYFRGMLGKLTVEDDAIYGEFLERCILSSLQSVSMDQTGKISGSNWGTNPSHFPIWIKDMYYSLLPAGMFDKELFKKAILWFEEFGIRHPGHLLQGGISHSLSVAMTTLMYSGIYYKSTGDKEFFIEHTRLKSFYEQLVDNMLKDRKDKSKFLFTTQYLSDGETYADWHTGTNVCTFNALKSLALLMRDVYNEPGKADLYDEIAEKNRRDIENTCLITSRFGTHYNEGVYADERQAQPLSDGEESDTTLMPFYGFCEKDDKRYQTFMRFSMSDENLGYCAQSKCVKWLAQPNKSFDGVPATIPGYMKGLGAIATNDEFKDPDGYLWNVLKISDADGALWWWPYASENEIEIDHPRRGSPSNGKSSWGTGVFCVLFIDRFLGVSYDALLRTLSVNPTALNSYSWNHFRIGNSKFSIDYNHDDDQETFRISNHNPHEIYVKCRNKVLTVAANQTTGLTT
jgi:hypothetical protein